MMGAACLAAQDFELLLELRTPDRQAQNNPYGRLPRPASPCLVHDRSLDCSDNHLISRYLPKHVPSKASEKSLQIIFCRHGALLALYMPDCRGLPSEFTT